MLFHLVRHTPVCVPHGLCYGRTDVDLASDSARHIAETIAKLPASSLGGARVWSSPALRCRRLADALTLGTAQEPRVDSRLAEFDFGHWEGRQWQALPQAELDAWNRDLANYAVPGGESLVTVLERARACIDDCLSSPGSEEAGATVIVSHGGVIRALLADALGMSLAAVFRLQVDYGSVSCMRHGPGGWRVGYINR